MSGKRAVAGYLFILPFIIGALLFFLKPLIQSLMFSFSSLDVVPGGYDTTWVGIKNYVSAFTEHRTFFRTLTESFLSMLANSPITLIFSFFAATLLNQKFRGYNMARAVFFLPVILSTGVIAYMESSDLLLNIMRASSQSQEATSSNMFSSANLTELLRQTKLNSAFIGYITGAIDGVYKVISMSGVQILIFLAGLQSVPPSLYEASTIEGATQWENFWKITFPMVSPLILVNLLYTVIDNMTVATNPMMKLVRDTAFTQTMYGYSAAMVWIYFLVIAIILSISLFIVSRYVFYQV